MQCQVQDPGGVRAGRAAIPVQGAAKHMLRAKMKLRTAMLAAAALACASVLLVARATQGEDVKAQPRESRLRGSVVDAKGGPVEGAWVYVFGPRCGCVLYSSGTILAWSEIETAKRPVFDGWIIGERHAFARSAADGRFAVTGVPPIPDGFVSVYHPRYLPTRVGPDEWQRTGRDIDVGRIVLREGKSIEGTVSDVEGQPIAGAFVGVQKVRRHRESDWDILPWPPKREAAKDEEYALCSIRPIKLGHVRSVRTDQKGHYRLTGLEPGLYLTGAWTAEHAPSEHEIELLGPNSALRRDFTLRRGESLTVMVTYTHSREPYPGAHVEVRLSGNPLRIASGRTDAAGRCILRGLAPGEYDVTADPDSPQRGFEAEGTFETGGESRLALDPLTPMSGTVVSAEDGSPVSSFSVRLRPNRWQPWVQVAGPKVAEAEPKPEDDRVRPGIVGIEKIGNVGGRFTIENARPGRWELHVLPSGFFPRTVEIKVPPAGLKGPLRIKLKAGKGTTTGLVLDDATGEPLEGAEVHCYETFSDPCRWWNDREAQTGREGRFSVGGLLGGSCRGRSILVKKAGYVEVRTKFDGSRPFPPKLASVRLVRAERTGAITGIVLDAAGRPVEGLHLWPRRIERWGEGARHLARTNRQGRFLLEKLRPGEYRITYLRYHRDVADLVQLCAKDEVGVRPGETTEVEIRLQAGWEEKK